MVWPFTKKPSAPKSFGAADLEMVAVAERAVAAFADYLGDDPLVGEVRDVKQLPGPKGALVNAFTVVLALERSPERRNALLQCGLLLSHFQVGVGDKPLRQMPDFSGDGEAMLNAVLAHRAEFERFNEVYPAAIAEAKQMAEKYQRSIDVALRRNAR